MILSADEKVVAFLDGVEKLEYKHKYALLSACSSPSALFADNRLIARYFERTGNALAGENLIRLYKDEELRETIVLKAVLKADAFITLWSADYPEEFRNVPVPPLALYCKGDASLLKSARKFAIVGSRKTTGQYAAATEEIASALADAGVTIVSGIAEGADEAALRGALKCGKAISVFAGGVDCVYPSSQRGLAERIAKNGLIISEKPCATPPRAYEYIARNRLIAGLSGGTLIVSGGDKSGARHTAGYALDYGRELFCLPYGLGSQGSLCKSLIKDGAYMVESAEEIANAMNYGTIGKSESLGGLEKQVYDLVKEGVGEVDDICERTDKSITEIIAALASLEMKKFVSRDFGGTYGAIK